MSFYVYEHTRNDTGAIFYVGKGTGYRCSTKSSRNRHWHNIVRKANGFKFYKIVENLDDELATLVEIERIDQLKKLGIKLANITEGGENGNPGFKLSEETKKLISQKKKGKPGIKHTKEWHEKMKLVHVGSKRSEETKKRISDAKKGKKQKVMWITNGIENKKVFKTQELEKGWKLGRTLNKNAEGKFI